VAYGDDIRTEPQPDYDDIPPTPALMPSATDVPVPSSIEWKPTRLLSRKILGAAISIITDGATDQPRPGQAALSDDIAKAMDHNGHLIGSAPTGVGKSLATGAPAMAVAVEREERTVMSTESIALQAQLINKDLPNLAEATERVTGRRPTFALLKGWSNYACFGPDVEVMTFDGVRRIAELSGTTARLLDGNGQWVDAEVRDYGIQDIIELTLSRKGVIKVIETTADHRWFTQKNANYAAVVETTTAGLRAGDRLPYVAPKNRVLGKMKPSTFGIAAGIVFGDGTRFRSTDGGEHPGACTIALYGEKNYGLARFFNDAPQAMEPAPRGDHADRLLRVSGLPSYFKDLPDLNVNTGYLYGWLAGYFAADGSVGPRGDLTISSANRSHLEFVTQVCAHLGIDHGSITGQLREGINAVGGEKTALYRLSISNRSVDEEFFLIDEHRRRWMGRPGTHRQHRAGRRWKVVSVRPTGRSKTVFCASVPTTASFTLEGNILTGNCADRASEAAQALLEQTHQRGFHIPDTPVGLKLWVDHLGELDAQQRTETVRVGGRMHGVGELADALLWALPASAGMKPDDDPALIPLSGHVAGPNAATSGATVTGDRHTGPPEITNDTWSVLSTTSGACPGTDDCEFGATCRPAAARERAADADIVVTNHAMIGVQAAKGVPVVIGSPKLGEFNHIVVDEAHALPGVVRSQGAAEVSARTLEILVNRLNSASDGTQGQLKINGQGLDIAKALERELQEMVRLRSTRPPAPGEVVQLKDEDLPITETEQLIDRWLDDTSKLMVKNLRHYKGDPSKKKDRIAALRAIDKIAEVKAAVADANRADPFTARWMELDPSDNGRAVVKLSPVVIAPSLKSRVWTGSRDIDDIDEPELYDLSVIAVSATVPRSFARDCGVKAQITDYLSPFADAYANSLLYVPELDAADIEALKDTKYQRAKPSMDTFKHRGWATDRIIELVTANGGHSLVLSATSASGKHYAAELRRHSLGRWNVYDQWMGGTTGRIVEQWRADPAGVLVGTRGLMTGVDAPGQTCSLVIVDRIPRAASNPVDDARVAALMIDAEIDKWTADLSVYVADTAVLVEQAAGRLIRSTSDSGMVAVLDPRLLKDCKLSMAVGARKAYLEAVAAFPRRTKSLARAVEFLTAQRDSR
jgi:ATP-dependent DNA helicase DinG